MLFYCAMKIYIPFMLFQVKLRVCLHVTEMKSHPVWNYRLGMKKILFTSEFHPGIKRVEFHPGMKFNLKENLPLRIMRVP